MKLDKQRIYSFDFGEVNVKNFNEKISIDKDFILYEKANDFPELLTKMLYNSSLHNSICNKRKDMICGNEIIVNKTSNKNKVATEEFINSINRNGENLNELLDKIAFDFVVFGMCAIQVIWGRGGSKIAELFHCPIDKIRMGKKDNIGNVNKYWYSERWSSYRKDEFKPVAIQAFSTIPEIIAVEPRQLLVIKPYSPGMSYYTMPSYVGALNYINLDWQISEFSNNYIKNGFFPNVVVRMKNVNEEEKEYIVDSFKEQYTAAQNSNKILFDFSEGPDSDTQFDTLDLPTMENMLTVLNDMTEKQILKAHGINPILVGISEAGSLGDASQINNAYLQYENTFIKPDQNLILNQINKLIKINGLDEVTISSSTPIPFNGSEDLMTGVLTVNEIREQLGYETLDESEFKNIAQNVIANNAALTPLPTNAETTTKEGELTPGVDNIQAEETVVNETIKNLSGRQMQGLLRIIKKHEKGDINEEMAITLMTSGFGITAEEAKSFLNISEETIKNNTI